jgi:hypothetical protein
VSALYNKVCAYSLLKMNDEAIESLERAIKYHMQNKIYARDHIFALNGQSKGTGEKGSIFWASA